MKKEDAEKKVCPFMSEIKPSGLGETTNIKCITCDCMGWKSETIEVKYLKGKEVTSQTIISNDDIEYVETNSVPTENGYCMRLENA